MKFNTSKFINYCKHVPRSVLVEATGVSRQTLHNRLRNNKITINNFLAICNALGEEPHIFFEEVKQSDSETSESRSPQP